MFPRWSPLAGPTIEEVDTRRHANLLVLTITPPDGTTLYNTPHDMKVPTGVTRIVMTETHGVASLQLAFTPPIGTPLI